MDPTLTRCALCLEPSSDVKPLTQKGMDNLIFMCKEKELREIYDRLNPVKNSPSDVYIHNDCRKKITRKRKRNSDADAPVQKDLRSSSATFDWKTCCFFCTKPVDYRHLLRKPIRTVETLEMKDKVFALAEKRKDEWGNKVYFRLQDCIDLVAVEAVYHRDCFNAFGKNIGTVHPR